MEVRGETVVAIVDGRGGGRGTEGGGRGLVLLLPLLLYGCSVSFFFPSVFPPSSTVFFGSIANSNRARRRLFTRTSTKFSGFDLLLFSIIFFSFSTASFATSLCRCVSSSSLSSSCTPSSIISNIYRATPPSSVTFPSSLSSSSMPGGGEKGGGLAASAGEEEEEEEACCC
jgi:hypothetical protein